MLFVCVCVGGGVTLDLDRNILGELELDNLTSMLSIKDLIKPSTFETVLQPNFLLVTIGCGMS